MSDTINIDQESLNTAVTFLEQYLVSKLPDYDFSPGTANRDIAINSMALITAYFTKEIDSIRDGLTLFDLQDKADASSVEMVDSILSDFFVTRHTGEKASGHVALYFSTNAIGNLVIKDTDLFVKSGVQFVNSSALTIITAEDLYKNTDTAGNVYYTYNMILKAVETGTEGRITQGLFSSWELGSPFLYKVEALEDFLGGEDLETSADLIRRSEKALTVKNLVTDAAIYTVLMQQFSFLKGVVPVGMHDPEMLRDKIKYTSGLTDVELHIGSYIDIYTKLPIFFRKELLLLVTSLDIEGQGIKSVIELPEAPTYRVLKVYNQDADDVEVEFSMYVPNLTTYLSSLDRQYVVVPDTFLGTQLTVVLDHVENYVEVQDFVVQKGNRTIVSNSLVKAKYPLYLSFDLNYYATSEVDSAAVTTTIQDFIHSGEVESNLYVASIIDRVTELYHITVQLPLVVTGNLPLPNGKTMTMQFEDKIAVPDRYLLTPTGDYLPYFSTTSNPDNYEIGSMSDLQISENTSRYVLDQPDVVVKRVV